jgi:hypothetical protein
MGERRLLSTIFSTHLQRKTQNKNVHPTIPPLFQRAHETIGSIWAVKTWADRASIWRRMQEHTERAGIQHLPLGLQAVAFVSNAPDLSNATRLTYSYGLQSILRRLDHHAPMLAVYSSALAAAGAGIPTEQAVPATREQVRTLVTWAITELHNIALAVAIYLMFKTASRFDDVAHLTKASLLQFCPCVVAQRATAHRRGRVEVNLTEK